MILACDQSLSCSGIAAIFSTGTILSTSVCTSPKEPWLTRLTRIIGAIEQFFNPEYLRLKGVAPEPVTVFVMESYAYGGSSKGFILGELGGVIKWNILSKNPEIPYYCIVPAHHKMFIARNGNADKQDTMRELEKRFGIVVDNDNIADAIAMGLLVNAAYKYKQGLLTIDSYDKLIFTNAGLLDERRDIRKPAPKSTRKNRDPKRKGKKRPETSLPGTDKRITIKIKGLSQPNAGRLGDLFDSKLPDSHQ